RPHPAGHPKGRGLVKKVSQLTTAATPILILRRDGRRRRPSRRRKGLGKDVVSSVAWFTNPDEPGGVRFDRNTTQSWIKCRSKSYLDVMRFHDLRAAQKRPTEFAADRVLSVISRRDPNSTRLFGHVDRAVELW